MIAVREAVEGCLQAGVEVLTLFAFSQENWQRPPEEIDALMVLLETYIAKEAEELRSRGVSVRMLGDLDRLAPSARAAVDRIETTTAGGDGLALNICLSYGSRARTGSCRAVPGGTRGTRRDVRRGNHRGGGCSRALYG